MGDFKHIPGLIVTVANHDALIDIGDPARVMALNPDLDVLCVPIKRPTESEEPRLELNKDIANSWHPVRLGTRFEGYKFNGYWTYRNSDIRKTKFCTKWHTETDSEANAVFDSLYVESLKNKEEVNNELFKDLPSLIEKIDELQNLIETTDPESLMKVELELDVLSETIQGIIKDYKKQHPEEVR